MHVQHEAPSMHIFVPESLRCWATCPLCQSCLPRAKAGASVYQKVGPVLIADTGILLYCSNCSTSWSFGKPGICLEVVLFSTTLPMGFLVLRGRQRSM